MAWSQARGTHLRAFLNLPIECFVILLIELINTLRSVAGGTSQYQFLINSEYAMDELEVSTFMSSVSLWHSLVGLITAPLVDTCGVRRIALLGLSLASLKQFVMATSASRSALLILFVPGDELLAVAVYSIALKQLTTPATRPIAFAVQIGGEWHSRSTLPRCLPSCMYPTAVPWLVI